MGSRCMSSAMTRLAQAWPMAGKFEELCDEADAQERRQLARVAVLNHGIDLELLTADADALRLATCDDHDPQSRRPQKADTEPVLDLVALELDRSPVRGAEIDPAVAGMQGEVARLFLGFVVLDDPLVGQRHHR